MTTIAIIGALNEEVALIAKSLSGVEHDRAASLDVTRGTIETADGQTVNVAATVGGMGLVNAAATTQHLIDAYRPDAVIFSGIAGNLNRELHVNDVVLGGVLRYLDTDMRLVGQWTPGTEDAPVEEFHSDERLLKLADAALTDAGIHHITGIIASGNYFVDTPEKVREVVLATGADAVEMEGAAVAHVAARNEVPALVIRALSDNADTDYEVFKAFDISEYADTAAKLVVDILRRLQ
ncbi:5'-methylthioadenosine/S-adenosylhomocysteine nucleosidase [Bifidobacterium vespertilionis]|uniref:adenosylhomocysteine nucleosidase n=1 Tax=Bifidobacterium vespertilionis TaxID=2562524 RepID=A0A5J5E159_9BIFI|nr:5'-methylthioadenosine/S-adenosylhomocysteine nucleosidase [Bifidobacterium vespertilionis]KAA8818368.1 5'-methylthioadenosine/S-adenosylhomocysteine nucleosidase [Bifidobacterium vespertilionis]KAA8822848.1 5'-methylthioadenosine/S-adenosylhomocysteine nucleosidase [Bifidobacterium vespertilionis]